MGAWTDAVEAAVHRQAAKSADGSFTLEQLVADELPRIVADSGSAGLTPDATLRRELQQLRDRGVVQFVDDQGTYRLIR